MKKLLLLLTGFGAFSAFAQPAFTANDYPAVGDMDSFRLATNFNYILDLETNTGSNHTWDFSAYNFTPNSQTYGYVTPNAAEYSNFPANTNLKEVSIAFTTDNLFEKTNDSLFLLRSGSTTSSGTYMVPKMPWLSFPMQYDDSMMASRDIYNLPNPNMAGFRRDHYYFYDGYGTVKLPWGDYGNLFRIRMVTRDSSYVIPNYVITYSAYYWYPAGGGAPIVRLHSTSTGDSINHAYQILANKSALPTAIADVQTTNGSIAVYPNPANETAFIRNTTGKPLTLNLYNMTAQNIRVMSIPASVTEVPLTDLAPGVYMLVFKDEQQGLTWQHRLIKTQ